MLTIVQLIPVWVFALLALLLALGHRQSKTRVVAPQALIGLAAGMTAMSLYGVVSDFGASPVLLGLWLAGLVAAVTLGARWLAPRGMRRVQAGPSAAPKVQVPGSWLPLVLMLGIFAGKFAVGMARSLGSPLLGQLWFMGGLSALFGVLSGGFTARAQAVWRTAAQG